jgi:hypothetical protein
MEKSSLGIPAIECCRCCLSTDGIMKNMLEEVFNISNFVEMNQDFRIEKTEIFSAVNLFQVLGMIGVQNTDDVSSNAWQQICVKCEDSLKFCLEFQQQCMKSLNVLKNIKDGECTQI